MHQYNFEIRENRHCSPYPAQLKCRNTDQVTVTCLQPPPSDKAINKMPVIPLAWYTCQQWVRWHSKSPTHPAGTRTETTIIIIIVPLVTITIELFPPSWYTTVHVLWSTPICRSSKAQSHHWSDAKLLVCWWSSRQSSEYILCSSCTLAVTHWYDSLTAIIAPSFHSAYTVLREEEHITHRAENKILGDINIFQESCSCTDLTEWMERLTPTLYCELVAISHSEKEKKGNIG